METKEKQHFIVVLSAADSNIKESISISTLKKIVKNRVRETLFV